MITEPSLPLVSGYVEVEVDGIRQYKNVRTGEITLSPKEESVETLTDQLSEANSKLATLDGTMTDLMMNVIPSLVTPTT